MLSKTLTHIVSVWLRPALDAIWFGRHLSWNLRWRLLAFQPLSLLTNALTLLPYLFRRPYTVEYIPVGTDGRSIRALVFHPGQKTGQSSTGPAASAQSNRPLPPLHVDCHAGGFIGGYPESSARFCHLLAQRTGAVVISLSYRLAPVHAFPAAIDDVDAAIAWLQKNAESHYGADARIMTVSGFSAGGNLVLASTQAPSCHEPAETAIKAAVTFYAPVDLRLAPWEKPKPEPNPGDPLAFLAPLFDSYAAPVKATMGDSPRMNPTLARVETLPERMLLVVPKIDIIVKEQLEFAERVRRENEDSKEVAKKVEVLFVEDAFHGYLEDSVVPAGKKMGAFEAAIRVIQGVHRQYGWNVGPGN